MLMCQKWITARSMIGAELLGGRIHLLQRDKKRVEFVEYFCVAACFVEEITASMVLGFTPPALPLKLSLLQVLSH